ncbi:MAG: Flp pilus assembly complex ATPase component TadA [Planctomycetaceae bacterium]|nr:Flp pilus assembly complex ATPase component TadA [Planctomycetaceae bacterium]
MTTTQSATLTLQSDTAQHLSSADLRRARDLFRADGHFEQFAFELGLDDEQQAIERLADALAIPWIDLTAFPVDTELVSRFPVRLIHRHGVFPLREVNSVLELAIANPFDTDAIDAAGAAMEMSVVPVIVSSSELATVIKSQFGVGAETLDGLIAQKYEDTEGVEIVGDMEWDESEAAEMAQQASVVKLVNDILTEAIESRTSDIHLEAQPHGMKIRYRIDGVLQTQPVPRELNRFQAAIISRLKIMSKMNIAEKRVPQDGRIKLRVSGREVDIRVSMIPMHHGEGVVMRVLDKDAMSFSLKGVGMEQETYDTFRELIRMPHGIVLVTGPTGSGKTTTLYSSLAEIKSERNKIITTEDPIEYQLEGINQIQVNPKVGLTFAAGLRSILRHDPDVVLVGEIRDLETAENAVQASLTGHMVFSTLHTNDAAGSFMRLTDMGVEPFLVSSTLEGVLAQRLVRTLCEECRQPWMPHHDDVPADFPLDEITHSRPIYGARGCRSCRGTGYRGRLGIYELLVANEKIRQLASERSSTIEIKKAAVASGMKTLRMDGWRKVAAGLTTIDEVLRVTKSD